MFTGKSKSSATWRRGKRKTRKLLGLKKKHSFLARVKRSFPRKAKPSSRAKGRNAQRRKRILNDLSITFKNCTFTYKDKHLSLKDVPELKHRKPKHRKSKLKGVTKWTVMAIDRLAEQAVGGGEHYFQNCLFDPPTMEERIQEFIRRRFHDVPLQFEQCRFVHRPSTVFEKIAKGLRRFFGVIFELNFITCRVFFEDSTFRLKDVDSITSYVKERLKEKLWIQRLPFSHENYAQWTAYYFWRKAQLVNPATTNLSLPQSLRVRTEELFHKYTNATPLARLGDFTNSDIPIRETSFDSGSMVCLYSFCNAVICTASYDMAFSSMIIMIHDYSNIYMFSLGVRECS